jgi:predicted transcriptional regulator
MATTIQVSEKLKRRLLKHKEHPRQPYEEVIAHALDLLEEDELDLKPAVKRRIAASRRRAARGEHLTTAEVMRELGL